LNGWYIFNFNCVIIFLFFSPPRIYKKMYDLTTLDGGYYATGGGNPFASVVDLVGKHKLYATILIAVLVVLVLALFFGYVATYKKEGLISGARASIGIGGSGRGDWGNPGDMVIAPNYGSESMSVSSLEARKARGLAVESANVAAAVVPGQPCSMTIANEEDAFAWRLNAAREKFGVDDNKLTKAMSGY
jgi:hypothetical protein